MARLTLPLPPTFDPTFYRQAHPTLRLADDAAAAAHYRATGAAAGLPGSPAATREGLVALLDPAADALEIGPFCQPLLVGPRVEYLDRLDAAGLRARATALGLPTDRCPERIHHLNDLRAVAPDRFDLVLASHALEHQPDLVRHLEEVARVLRIHGRYVLVLPDKRYCFDHFLPETSLADVLDAWHEERRTHRLGSVVEHVALTTHNDPVRHWAGDHAPTDAPERMRRTVEALDAHRRADGAYLDVHAWQFTPDGFADLLAGLARLDHSAFEVERVYQTPRNRAEFCAVLRRVRPARRSARRHRGPQVLLMQTADAFRYAPMLAVTQPNVVEYARRHGFAYEAFVGVKRGAHAWQATYNRIPMLLEQVVAGRRGWAVYLDADAYINDLDFDLVDYLHRHRNRAAVFATSGVTGNAWDVNAGVALVNLDHPLGRRLVRGWAERFARLSDAELAASSVWREGDNDQDLLHDLLRQEPEIAAAVHVEAMDLLNSAAAQFVRQRLRAQFDVFDARLTALADEVAMVGRAFGLHGTTGAPDPAGRAAARLMHHVRAPAWLAEAAGGAADEAAGRRALAQWRAGPQSAQLDQDQAFAALLDEGDPLAVANTLAGLGRAEVARGLLGGDRQHGRVARDPAFEADRLLRTQDALLSLAELSGAVPVENPDRGRWGDVGRLPPAALFAAIERVLGTDLAPPPTIGAYLGVEVGRGLVLHLRMVEAIHMANRLRAVLNLLGLVRVRELGGGVGLLAWYARALGVADYRLASTPVLAALQAGVLAGLAPPVPVSREDDVPVDLVVAEDLPGLASGAANDWMRGALAGARALLSFAHEAPADPARPEPTVGDLLAALGGGWRRVSRTRHGLKPGYLEELWLRDAASGTNGIH